MVVKGLVVPDTLAVLLEYDPVINGISWVTLTSASSLFMVMSEGVEMMLLEPSLRSACRMAAKLVPDPEPTRPSPSVTPVPTVELVRPEAALEEVEPVVVEVAAPPLRASAARLTMLVPPPGKLLMP